MCFGLAGFLWAAFIFIKEVLASRGKIRRGVLKGILLLGKFCDDFLAKERLILERISHDMNRSYCVFSK